MLTAYGYGRHSTGRQCVTAEVQEASVRDQFERLLRPKGYSWGGWFYDAAMSGASDFTDRPEGLRVYMIAEKGDAIISHNSDRMFRNTADAKKCVALMRKRGIALVMPDLPVFDSADSRLMSHIRFDIAQWEREKIAERTSVVLRHMSDRGVRLGGRLQSPPLGWRLNGNGFTPCPEERARIEQMAKWHAAGLSFERISMIVSYPLYCWRRPIKYRKGGAWSKRYVRLAIKARSLGYPRCHLYSRARRTAGDSSPSAAAT